MSLRLVLISDTHGLHDSMKHAIPDGDVLIHAGDFTNIGSLSDVQKFDRWLGTLPHKHKLAVAGNHERGWDQPGRLLGKNLVNAHYLQDSSINIDGKNFYGSPWTPTFGYGWAFNAHRGAVIKQHWDKIPDAGRVDVVITHGPPAGILDKAFGVESVGCEDLARQILISQPLVHCFGHIHSGRGQKTVGPTTYVNAAICNEAYELVNPPIVVEI